eukprot:5532479-Prymnesium_polylepis.1
MPTGSRMRHSSALGRWAVVPHALASLRIVASLGSNSSSRISAGGLQELCGSFWRRACERLQMSARVLRRCLICSCQVVLSLSVRLHRFQVCSCTLQVQVPDCSASLCAARLYVLLLAFCAGSRVSRHSSQDAAQHSSNQHVLWLFPFSWPAGGLFTWPNPLDGPLMVSHPNLLR